MILPLMLIMMYLEKKLNYYMDMIKGTEIYLTNHVFIIHEWEGIT